MSSSQQRRNKGRFHIRLEGGDYLNVTIWPGKKEPEAEVITTEIRRQEGDEWRTIGRLAVYRTPEGTYRQLPDLK